MERKLAEYRAKKESDKKAEQTIFRRLFSRASDNVPSHIPTTEPIEKASSSESKEVSEKDLEKRSENQECSKVIEDEPRTWVFYTLLGLKVLLWLLLWKYFIELGFGAVYFVVSGSYLMYLNTRTGPKKKNQLSAYSVFNPNQERLDGTFTAEQFEKELRFGATSVK